jgi:hypothetical protein
VGIPPTCGPIRCVKMGLPAGCLAVFMLLMLLPAHGLHARTLEQLPRQSTQRLPVQRQGAAAVRPPAAGAGSRQVGAAGSTSRTPRNERAVLRAAPKAQAGSAAARAALAAKPYGPVARRSSNLQFTFHLHKPFYYPENILPGVQVYFLDWSTPQVSSAVVQQRLPLPPCAVQSCMQMRVYRAPPLATQA